MIKKYTDKEKELLARLMRAEAVGEGDLGMLMVGNVGVNRVLADCLTFKDITTLSKMIYQSPGRVKKIVQLKRRSCNYMNNYCIHLKKRKNKPYCNIIKKEISFSCCQECDNKEYKKSTNLIKNDTFQENISPKNAKKVENMKNKSKKLAKLERDRFSVFTDDLEHCILCGKKKNDLHEVFGGRNRLNSIKFNLVIPLCRECHSLNQNNPFFNDHWHKIGQEYFECNIGSRNEFLKVFRRNYLK